jgi:hypothetical protein
VADIHKEKGQYTFNEHIMVTSENVEEYWQIESCFETLPLFVRRNVVS